MVKLPYAMANGGVIDGRDVISEAYIEDVFTADDRKQASWQKGPYGNKLDVFKHYSQQWYVVDDAIAVGIGSYGQYLLFDRKNNVALAMFSTYDIGQDSEKTRQDVLWLVEKARSL
jgi:CubicO group peptidase (beta-lactamase class C family)